MILVSLSVGVVFTQKQRQFTQLGAALEAHFSLQCLLCGEIHQLSTPTNYRLKKDEKPYSYIHQITTVVRQTRSCTNCGIISTLPEAEVKALQKTLEKTITQEFIDLHSQDQPPFLAQRMLERLMGG